MFRPARRKFCELGSNGHVELRAPTDSLNLRRNSWKLPFIRSLIPDSGVYGAKSRSDFFRSAPARICAKAAQFVRPKKRVYVEGLGFSLFCADGNAASPQTVHSSTVTLRAGSSGSRQPAGETRGFCAREHTVRAIAPPSRTALMDCSSVPRRRPSTTRSRPRPPEISRSGRAHWAFRHNIDQVIGTEAFQGALAGIRRTMWRNHFGARHLWRIARANRRRHAARALASAPRSPGLHPALIGITAPPRCRAAQGKRSGFGMVKMVRRMGQPMRKAGRAAHRRIPSRSPASPECIPWS